VAAVSRCAALPWRPRWCAAWTRYLTRGHFCQRPGGRELRGPRTCWPHPLDDRRYGERVLIWHWHPIYRWYREPTTIIPYYPGRAPYCPAAGASCEGWGPAGGEARAGERRGGRGSLGAIVSGLGGRGEA
jgi:hypothetical protein